MSQFRTDPLLIFCRLLSWLILVFVAGGCLFALCAAVATLVNGDFVIKALRASYPALKDDGLRTAFTLAMLLIALGTGLVVRFMAYLLALIRSIAAGLAFTRLNAARIRGMAWVSLAGVAAFFAMTLSVQHVVTLIGPRSDAGGIHIQAPTDGFAYGHVLMTLLLFVLARLFTQAAAMRDEIEATV